MIDWTPIIDAMIGGALGRAVFALWTLIIDRRRYR